jgi:hypothetical protein
LKTIDDIRYVANLIKTYPGERKANIMGKEVSISEEGINLLKEFLEK